MLRKFGIFCDTLVHFPPLWCVARRKIWQPWLHPSFEKELGGLISFRFEEAHLLFLLWRLPRTLGTCNIFWVTCWELLATNAFGTRDLSIIFYFDQTFLWHRNDYWPSPCRDSNPRTAKKTVTLHNRWTGDCFLLWETTQKAKYND
jgi:hypothetical protein